jgi:uncharacterized protein YbaR (Trm112 family)
MRRAILLVLVLALGSMPIVQANGGVIESVEISGDDEFGPGQISFNMTLSSTVTELVNWTATLKDLEGETIDFESGSILVESNSVNVSGQLGDAPLGLSNLSIFLENGENWYTVIHRLRPLDISLGQMVITPVNQDGSDANATMRDGDFARIDIPVINDGDLNWSGNLTLSIIDGESSQQVVVIDADSSVVMNFQTGPFSEGIYNFEAVLDAVGDMDSSDENTSIELAVGPPPLPILSLNLTRNFQPVSGQEMSWNLSAQNTGEVSFTGNITCMFGDLVALDIETDISIGQSVFFEPSVIAFKDSLVCNSSQQRVMNDARISDFLDIESALFIGAGHNTPTLLGGPWHEGDTITLSLLIRNEGDMAGNSSLNALKDDDVIAGESLFLNKDKAGEITLELSWSQAGNYSLPWYVNGQGSVDSNLSGNLSIPVLKAQVLKLDISNIDIINGETIIDWEIDLSAGKSRSLALELGKEKDGQRFAIISFERDILSGITSGTTNLGQLDGQGVYFSGLVSDWVIGFGSDIDNEMLLPDNEPEPVITISPTTQPVIPTAGEKVTLFYSLSNDGTGDIPSGTIVFKTSDGSVLATVESDIIQSASEKSIVITWPEGDTVKIVANWYAGDSQTTTSVSISSTVKVIETDNFSIPWGGILGGLGVGIGLILIIRIRNGPTKERKKKPKPKKITSDKVEVACPNCDRRLNVPSSYNGKVGCPECETKFDVVAEEEAEPEPDLEPDQPQELWSASDNDILACPQCTRKLKVPFDKRPAKARCPACETIFEARTD